MNAENQDEMEIDLREIFGLLRSRIWLILIVTVIVAASVGTGSKFLLKPIYTSSTKLYIVNKSQSIASLSLSDLQMGTQLTKDYMVLVKSRPVTEQVIKNLNLDMKHEQLLNMMTLSNPSDTRILEISVDYPDAFMAKQIVDEIASVSSKRIAVIMDMKEPNIVEEGHVAEIQSSPNVLKNTVIAGIVGFMGAVAFIAVRFIMDDTIKSSEDVERYLGINTIGLIPVEEEEGFTEQEKRRQRRYRGRKAEDN